MPKPFTTVGRRVDAHNWYETVLIDGAKYWVAHERGKRVSIAFKPRGENTGYKWRGTVRSADGRTLWSGEVNKSTSARWMLEQAKLIPLRPSEIRKRIAFLEERRLNQHRAIRSPYFCRTAEEREREARALDRIEREIEALTTQLPQRST